MLVDVGPLAEAVREVGKELGKKLDDILEELRKRPIVKPPTSATITVPPKP